ncbi:MAG: TIGR01777 family protein [Propionibacteriales bacterium]|nr:TIGR01777 family protein [Propionibacteriales bacterium]
MKIVLSGASGFLGTALRDKLRADGHELVRLVRGTPQGPDQSRWDPYARDVDPQVLADADAVVNLAGVAMAHVPWNESYKQKVMDSRVATTRTLADAVAALGGTTALVNASGINYYGTDRGNEQLDEDCTPGTGFLAEVCQRWEASTVSAREAGARVAVLRTAIVLDQSGGSFRLMSLPFRLGVGGRLGSGRQWFPTVSLADYVDAVARIVTDDSLSGAYNVTAPVPATNAEFTKELGRQLHRPTLMVVPGVALTTVVGDLGEAMLGSIKATPRRLLEAGFQFSHPTIADQLQAALG